MSDETEIIRQGIRGRSDRDLTAMRRSHGDKTPRIQEQLDELEDADGFRGRVWAEMKANQEAQKKAPQIPTLSRLEAVARVTEQRERLRQKHTRVSEAYRLVGVEQERRR